jgi:ComF family protein
MELLSQQNWRIDLVTAVPLGPKRLSERGFNQSKLLAMPLAYYSDLRFNSSAIKRIKITKSQVGLTYIERTKNVNDAFLSKPSAVAGHSILIVDDVITTGATINACAKSLIKAGACNVYGITLARAARVVRE